MSCLLASVGEGGVNRSREVKYVQFLLCDWQYCRGGVGIVVDGIVGPKTKAEIRKFQSECSGIVDGRIDPSGPSIKALETAHINSLILGIGVSASRYRYLPFKPAAFGPLLWDTLVSRYLSSLYNAFN
jgi:peptidoglycan hydrolase-like protein with peptidoglycan-binding domain